MKAQKAALRSHASEERTTKYARLAVLSLIAILVAGIFLSAPSALAVALKDGGLSAKEQLGLEASSARWAAVGRFYADQLERAAATDSARWAAAGRFYTDRFERAAAADAARWAAAGLFYSNLFERAAVVSSARYSAMAVFYAGGLVAGSDDHDVFSANPELGLARSFYAGRLELSSDQDMLAANPELGQARRFSAGRLVRSLDASSARWVAAGRFYTDRFERAAAASSARYSAMAATYFAGLATCGISDSSLAANPELVYLGRKQGC